MLRPPTSCSASESQWKAKIDDRSGGCCLQEGHKARVLGFSVEQGAPRHGLVFQSYARSCVVLVKWGKASSGTLCPKGSCGTRN